MKSKRIVRWVIVLFLLAALPVMTAVMAQEQGPVTKQLPVVTEASESQAPAVNVNESEPNNTMAQADVISLNDVVAGTITSGDRDWFKFYVSEAVTPTLFDVDAASIGSGLDSVITLFTNDGTLAHSNDDTDTLDSLLYFSLSPGWYYLELQDYDEGTGAYNLIVSTPLLISAAAQGLGQGIVAGIPFKAEDILAWSDLNNGQEKWVLFVDGSDLGWKSVANITTVWNGGLSFGVGFLKNQIVTHHDGHKTTVTPWDWAIYYLWRVGGVSEGTVPNSGAIIWGPYESLSTGSEKIDALSALGDNFTGTSGTWDVFLSTIGKATVPGAGGTTLKLDDEDIFLAQMTPATNPYFNQFTFFDGSRIAGLYKKDVVAAEYQRSPSTMFMTIAGKATISGSAVNQMDIFAINLPGHTWGGVVWHGPDHGWNYNIDAIEWAGP